MKSGSCGVALAESAIVVVGMWGVLVSTIGFPTTHNFNLLNCYMTTNLRTHVARRGSG